MIDIYSDTDEAPYNPMLTTYYVSGRIEEQTMFPLGNMDSISERLRANIHRDTPVVKLDARNRALLLKDGSRRQYDDIVIATGAGAVIPPVKNLPSRGIYTMRTASDARRLEKALDASVRSAVVVGAQMVGIKVVELLVRRGVRTVLADMEKQMFPASAYPDTAEIIAARLENAGVRLKLGQAVTGVEDTGNALTLSFSGGGSESCDLVVFCSGIRPNLNLIDREELETGVGIKTDLHMQSSVPHIYAAGDCCETLNVLTGENAYIGLWANSAMEGRVAGRNIAGIPDTYRGNLIHNITHYMDTDFISAGNVKTAGEHILWEKRDGSWRMEATVSGGRIMALNILDNANLSGPVKNILLHQAANPKRPMSAAAKLILCRSGVPENIVKALGGEQT